MLRLGVVDFDSSHCIEFTRRFNGRGVTRDQCVEGAQVVLGWPGDSSVAPQRIPEFQRQMVECGVELVASPVAMLGRVDAVLILSLGGEVHLERARPFLEAGLPTYVDKPFTCTQADARTLVDLAAQHNSTLFVSSALRYSDDVEGFPALRQRTGHILGAVVHGPGHEHPSNPGLLHYGIHAVEVLYTLMGRGCEWVHACHTEQFDVVTGNWTDGRIGSVRVARTGDTRYGFQAFCEGGLVQRPVSTRFAYRNLCRKMVSSFQNGRPALEPTIPLEILGFITAALRSQNAGGARVELESID
ncbi:MAG: Gfo/Idh/MocA family oxidoreductase [Planctomycetaceae bacterium]